MKVGCKMDWGKAKNILILTFLLLNILLGVQIYLKQSDYFHNMLWTSNTIDAIKKDLSERQIVLKTEIPKAVPKMSFIQVKAEEISAKSSFSYELAQPIDQKKLADIIGDWIDNFTEYHFDSYQKQPDRILYHQNIEDYPFWGAKLKVYIQEGELTNYEQTYVRVLNKGMEREVVSAYTVLRSLIDDELLPKRSEILQMRLGYNGDLRQTTMQVLAPVWRIDYKTGEKDEVIYVNALTGGVENIINY